jgi:proton glutamate symport protein
VTAGNRSRSLSFWITAALLAGLAVGVLAADGRWPALAGVLSRLEPVGTLWINLIRMVVVPLVMAALISGVLSLGGIRRLGRLGVRTLAFFWGTTFVAIAFGLVLSLVVMPLAALPPETAAELRGAASSASQVVQQVPPTPSVAQFFVDLVPTNPIKAAAEGALLPVIVFSILFGAAAATLEEKPRRAIGSLAEAVLAVLIRLIGWFMAVAPIGVFCLAAPVTARYGWGMLGSLAVFIGVVAGGLVLFGVAVYAPLATGLARVRLLPFARAIAPAQAVGFSTTSSMAALPAMMDAAGGDLGISSPISSFVLPLGATLNRPGTGVYHAAAAVFVATLYGIPLGAGQIAAIAATTFLMTLSVAAVPSGTVLTLAPVLLAAGLPVQAIGLLLGVDRIPDMFRVGTNVTGDLVAAAVVARGEGEKVMGAG